MTRRARHTPAQRLRQMHDRLERAYGPQFWWPAETAFEVILGAYLTQNTSWKAVERSLANLRAADALSVEGLRRLRPAELERLIRPSGFYTRKGPAIRAFVTMLDNEFAGSLKRLAAEPSDVLRHRLISLPGVGYETADAILLYALGHAVPVADAYLRRVAERHRLIIPGRSSHKATYAALAQLTRDAFALDPISQHARLFNEFHAVTVAVGKVHCSPTPNCKGCPLEDDPHSV